MSYHGLGVVNAYAPRTSSTAPPAATRTVMQQVQQANAASRSNVQRSYDTDVAASNACRAAGGHPRYGAAGGIYCDVATETSFGSRTPPSAVIGPRLSTMAKWAVTAQFNQAEADVAAGRATRVRTDAGATTYAPIAPGETADQAVANLAAQQTASAASPASGGGGGGGGSRGGGGGTAPASMFSPKVLAIGGLAVAGLLVVLGLRRH